MPDAPAQDALPLETPPRPEPFVAPASAAALADLRARLRATRWPDAPEDAGWSLGTDLDYLRELVAYWADEFDWPAQEAALARLPRFRVALGDLRIHFVHARAVGAAESSMPALPLVLSHGWPDSFWRYSKVIPLLTDPGAHGADPADAFDVVVPDMPGYGYSDHPAGLPLDSIGVAGLWAELMSVLGYERFGAAGGDIGSGVSRYLALDQPDRVVAVHRMDVGLPVFTGDPAELTGEERAFLDRTAAWGAAEGAYAAMHRTKPQTAAFGLTDSPAGLAAWIVEKLRAWSDCGGDVERTQPGRDPDQRHALLAHRHDRLVDAHVPRERRDPAGPARPPGRGAVRVLAVPRRPGPAAPGLAGTCRQRGPRDQTRPRWPLRADRGARAVRSRTARVLPPLPGRRGGLRQGSEPGARAVTPVSCAPETPGLEWLGWKRRVGLGRLPGGEGFAACETCGARRAPGGGWVRSRGAGYGFPQMLWQTVPRLGNTHLVLSLV